MVLGVALLLATREARAQLPVDASLLEARHDSLVVRVQGQVLGWQTSQLTRNDGAIRVVDQFDLGEFGQQRTEIQLTKEGRLRWVQQGGILQGVPIRASLEYRRNQVRGVTVVPSPQGPVTLEADTTLPPGAIDDNAIALFLPTLPWAEGARWSFPVFIGGENTIRTMTLTVLGTASVSLPAGPIDTWEAELDGGRAPVRFYVTRSSPHRLARIEVVGTGLEFVLVN
ncbi:MAG TPA: DUF3108 domain-containing protein [Gemmatimonadales bacterium]|nr:DUF3108 domain-containing protein [Gemmatimonadales bacterium]